MRESIFELSIVARDGTLFISLQVPSETDQREIDAVQGRVATALALGSTLAYAVCQTIGAEAPVWVLMTVFHFLPILLPVVAASLISLISINDLQRRVARYREMQLMLEESRKQVAFCQTWNSLERVVLKTERALLQEVLEWHSITSFAESH